MEFLYETHMHTSETSACAISTAAEQVCAYKNRGYAGVVITDHFINGNSTVPGGLTWEEKMNCFVSGFENAKAAGESYGLDVFLGWEYTIRGLDFLTYGLDLEFLIEHPGIDKLTIEEYSGIVREHGGYIAQAHPFRSAWYIENGGAVDHRLLDGIEVFNSADSSQSNGKALKFAKKHSLPVQAGSDSHSVGHGLHTHLSGIALSSKAGDIFDIISAIKSKSVKLI